MADVPDGANLSFHLSGIISDHRKNLGRIRKIETLPILQICPRPSQTIEISTISSFRWFVGKIWDSREQENLRSFGIFPTYENQALNPDHVAARSLQSLRSNYKTTLNYKTPSGKKQTLKEAKYNTATYEKKTTLW